jgi:hypothetical protein
MTYKPAAGSPQQSLLPYYAAAIAMCVLALLLGYAHIRPARGIFREMSGVSAMTGYVLVLLQLAVPQAWLAGRLGTEGAARLRCMVAALALILVVAHPLLMAMPTLVKSPAQGLSFLWKLFSYEGLRSGVATWILAIFLLVLTLRRGGDAPTWPNWIVAVVAIAIATLGIHHALRAAYYGAGWALIVFWVVLTVAALAALLYERVIVPLRGQQPQT